MFTWELYEDGGLGVLGTSEKTGYEASAQPQSLVIVGQSVTVEWRVAIGVWAVRAVPKYSEVEKLNIV
jgi:hypothetical protein